MKGDVPDENQVIDSGGFDANEHLPEGMEFTEDVSDLSEDEFLGLQSDLGDDLYRAIENGNEDDDTDGDTDGDNTGDNTNDSDGNATEENNGAADGDNNGENGDDALTQLYSSLNLDEAGFLALPEETQDAILTLHESAQSGANSEEMAALQTELDDYRGLQNDPVMAARVAMLQNNGTAPNVTFTDDELKAFDELSIDDPAALQNYLHELFQAKAGDLVLQAGDAIVERQRLEKEHNDAEELLGGMDKLDTRLKNSMGLSLKDIVNLQNGDGESAQLKLFYNTEYGQFIKFLCDGEFKFSQMNNLGAEKLYKLYAAEKGWDKEDLKAAMKDKESSARALLMKKRVAQSPKANGRQKGGDSGSFGEFNGINLDAFKDPAQVSDLYDRYSDNEEMLDKLDAANEEFEKRKENKR